MPKRVIENMDVGFGRQPNPAELQRHLRAGAGNSDLQYGFLGPDENLEKLIEADAKLLEERGLTHHQVASAIEELFACDSFEEFRGAPIFPLQYIHSPPCPWQDFVAVSPFDLSEKVTEIVVINRTKVDEFFRLLEERGDMNLNDYPELVRRELAMVFSDLHPHLIRDHRFFEGHATSYRVDPTKVAHFLSF